MNRIGSIRAGSAPARSASRLVPLLPRRGDLNIDVGTLCSISSMVPAGGSLNRAVTSQDKTTQTASQPCRRGATLPRTTSLNCIPFQDRVLTRELTYIGLVRLDFGSWYEWLGAASSFASRVYRKGF
jgi:hypothetical protein